MTDQELLEKAARAAGIDHNGWLDATYYHAEGLELIEMGATIWNPLIEDADAFRLVVALSLNIEVYLDRVIIQTDALDDEGNEIGIDKVYCFDTQSPEWVARDAKTATRRAIVEAAAAMGSDHD